MNFEVYDSMKYEKAEKEEEKIEEEKAKKKNPTQEEINKAKEKIIRNEQKESEDDEDFFQKFNDIFGTNEENNKETPTKMENQNINIPIQSSNEKNKEQNEKQLKTDICTLFNNVNLNENWLEIKEMFLGWDIKSIENTLYKWVKNEGQLENKNWYFDEEDLELLKNSIQNLIEWYSTSWIATSSANNLEQKQDNTNKIEEIKLEDKIENTTTWIKKFYNNQNKIYKMEITTETEIEEDWKTEIERKTRTLDFTSSQENIENPNSWNESYNITQNTNTWTSSAQNNW